MSRSRQQVVFDTIAPSVDCGCGAGGPVERPDQDPLEQPFVLGRLETPVGPVPVVGSELSRCDRWGGVKARWNIGRMNYKVAPGLYALGGPTAESPVLVTANYKLTFDRLRRSLPGLSAWLLVLDTKGINVWCAAGKGTFGTDELIARIKLTGLEKIVEHRKVIVPQLGAPGVAAHKVKPAAGFEVVYGPIRAEDIPAFLKAGMKVEPGMRRVEFPVRDRAVLIPVELTATLKYLALILPAIFFLGGLVSPGEYWAGVLDHGLFGVIAVLGGAAAGVVLTPLLLPWLPGRAFSLKGMWAGAGLTLLLIILRGGDFDLWSVRLEAAAWLLSASALTAFLVMNFTGSSTYTSLSGVKAEMRRAVPLEIAGAAAGLILWFGSRLAA